MKSKICLLILGLFAAAVFSNCATARQKDFSQYSFSAKNTLSIFLLNNDKGYYFVIPVQYIGDYQIAGFEFDNGNILIGDYDILLKRDEINISVYLNETADENGNTSGEFNLIYQEENGRVLASKMAEPLAIKKTPDYMMNQYDIYIEKYLTDDDMKNIINEYEKRNVYSKLSIWYDITIDNEEQNGSGILDDFELHSGPVNEYLWLLPHFEFFRAKYLQSSQDYINVSGNILTKQFYGPPNYGETPEIDKIESYYILQLNEPITFTRGYITETVEEIQLIISDDINIDLITNWSYTVNGNAFFAETGHHHTPVIIIVNTIITDKI